MSSFSVNKDGSETFTPSTPAAKVVEFNAKNDPGAIVENLPDDVPEWDDVRLQSKSPAAPVAAPAKKAARKG